MRTALLRIADAGTDDEAVEEALASQEHAPDRASNAQVSRVPEPRSHEAEIPARDV